MLTELLSKRNLPELKSPEEMLKIMQDEVFGHLPAEHTDLTFEVEEDHIMIFCAGKAHCNKITAKCRINGVECSFPFFAIIPKNAKNVPFFVHVNFFDLLNDCYTPIEEIIDNGYAVFTFFYTDVTADNNDFTDKIAGAFYKDGKRSYRDAGKIAIWAWAAQRVLDYAYTLGDALDFSRATICGHSRLGKTALLAGAIDKRFKFVYSNDSGCSGASLSRGNTGEQIKNICSNFPYWFNEKYLEYIDRAEAMPFDQHYLVAASAPRFVLVGSAADDWWADPVSEMLSCVAASAAFENGFEYEDRLPVAGDAYLNGDIGYHMRAGQHYFGRQDWQRLMTFVEIHR
ncbi:MAG: hypothetical protein E7315_05295 [Clostridiales bacterium]|nr:hypothetical protein [Clostridiales bacterium]